MGLITVDTSQNIPVFLEKVAFGSSLSLMMHGWYNIMQRDLPDMLRTIILIGMRLLHADHIPELNSGKPSVSFRYCLRCALL